MEDISVAQALADFAQRHSGVIIESTSATVVIYTGDLYNVVGSTPDPKINGVTWKQLLINNGIGTNSNDHCYATLPLPTGSSSHPNFSVGGHMTPNSDGSVPTGGSCYLMPLCYWHNSTSNNGVPFPHSPDTMLQLSGYMQSDLAATFVARMPSAAPYTLVGAHDGNVFTADVAGPDVASSWVGQKDAATGGAFPEHYILFRQIREKGLIKYVIEDARVPDPASKQGDQG